MSPNCEQVTRLASEFLARRLGPRARLGVLLHLAMCRGCRAWVEQLRLTLRALAALPAPTAPPPTESLLARFRASAREDRGRDA